MWQQENVHDGKEVARESTYGNLLALLQHSYHAHI